MLNLLCSIGWRPWEGDTHTQANPWIDWFRTSLTNRTYTAVMKWQLSRSANDLDLFCPGLRAQALAAPFLLSSQQFEADVISILQLRKLRLREVLAKHFTVKNCEGSEILPYLLPNESACHWFMGAGRKHQIPGSEAKDFMFLAQQTAWASRTHHPPS